MRSIKESCLERMILFGEDALRIAVREFVAHYHHGRNHQGIGNVLIFPEPSPADCTGPVRCRSRLGGMLNYYDRASGIPAGVATVVTSVAVEVAGTRAMAPASARPLARFSTENFEIICGLPLSKS